MLYDTNMHAICHQMVYGGVLHGEVVGICLYFCNMIINTYLASHVLICRAENLFKAACIHCNSNKGGDSFFFLLLDHEGIA